MRGDFTRSTFRPENHYAAVLLQQGRVQMDADWNEHVDIRAHLGRTTNEDIIGHCGGPIAEAGFGLSVVADDLEVSDGRYYVEGVLCENEAALLITEQPDLPGFLIPTEEGIYLAYLVVWERHLTHLDDPRIREIALGGPDTATRARTVWQVNLLRIADLDEDVNCTSDFPEWTALTTPSAGTLAARARPGEESADPCIIPPGGGFRRLENQLYRIEVHDPGGLGVATFKWSRDNGSLVVRLEAIVGDELTVTTPGRDPATSFAPGQWIEVTDDRHDLWHLPGTLVQVLEVDGNVLTVDLATATGPLTGADFPLNPQVHRWDSPGAVPITIPGTNDGYLELEDGVEVLFSNASYRTGDYWLVPARTITADVEWPEDSLGNAIPEPPRGIMHRYCRLGLVEVREVAGENQLTVLEDCRDFFPPLTELTSLFYVSGDGQDAIHDPSLPQTLLPLEQPLIAGVANGQWPVEGATVLFEVTEGNGRLQGTGPAAEVTTDSAGMASCTWELDPDTRSQQVRATLLDAGGDPMHLPVVFTAEVLEITGLYYVGGDGQEAKLDPANPAQLLPLAPLQAGVARGSEPVAGATVRFTITEGAGTLQGAGATADIVTDAAGLAACQWALDAGTPVQRVEAVLLESGDGPFHLPIRFTATLPRTAAQVPYSASDCPDLADAATVQEAIDLLCQREEGQPDPAIRVVTVLGGDGGPFRNDTPVPPGRLVAGINLVCDDEVAQVFNPDSMANPTCFVVLYLPYPLNPSDLQFWGRFFGGRAPIVGFNPLVLAGSVTAEGNRILWRPQETTAEWLLQPLWAALTELEITGEIQNRLLCRFIAKGNFIWAANDRERYLDGEVFGVQRAAAANIIDLRLDPFGPPPLDNGSGDGVRGGDFEMWFWLVRG